MKIYREIIVKAGGSPLEEALPGCFTPILIKELLVLIAGTGVGTSNYKYLQSLLHIVCLLSSPLVDSTLRGSLAVHVQKAIEQLVLKKAA